MVDVEPGAIGEDDVRRAKIVEFGVGLRESWDTQVESAGIP
jgi:hypothetical protein